MQYLPKNKQPFYAGKQSFEQNITPPVAYRARKITATLQQTQSGPFNKGTSGPRFHAAPSYLLGFITHSQVGTCVREDHVAEFNRSFPNHCVCAAMRLRIYRSRRLILPSTRGAMLSTDEIAFVTISESGRVDSCNKGEPLNMSYPSPPSSARKELLTRV